MRRILTIAGLSLLTGLPGPLPAGRVASIAIRPIEGDARLGRPLPLHVEGRAVTLREGGVRRQWPGTYIEAAYRGTTVDLKVGPGQVSLRIGIDQAPPISLVRPAPGLYRISAPQAGPHRIRIAVASESQDAPTDLGGLFAAAGTRPLPAPRPRTRRIEFVGDSHTVGYGNTSPQRSCSKDAVWETTDTTRGPAGVTAARYGADYRVNAISGRGVVRNYDGMDVPTLPAAYPFALLDGRTRAADAGWHPHVVVIGLGTNDFSTPLKAGERWASRAALHADYERRYVDFLAALRRRYPRAFFILWATDMADGEIAQEAGRVAGRARAAGERRIAFVPVDHLSFGGCDAHPDSNDDRTIAAALGRAIDARTDIWEGR